MEFLTGYIVFFVCLALIYGGLMYWYVQGWRDLPAWEPPPDFEPNTRISVVIPARNEAACITACLRAIQQNRYPPALLEVLVVDDFSEDTTATEVSRFAQTAWMDVRLLPLSGAPHPRMGGKKKALAYGIEQSRGTLIVTTDADCLAPPEWLYLLASAYELQGPAAIAGPVMIHGERTLLQRFQALDMAGMMGITGAGIYRKVQRMGNGANLAFPKALFEAVDGYRGNEERASGDDLFLLQKIARTWPDGIFFLKNPQATVLTGAAPDLRAFVRQRLRWGTKNAALPETAVRLVLAVVWVLCLSIPVNLILALWFPPLAVLAMAQLAVKAAADYSLLNETCCFFNRSDLLRGFWPSFFLHTAYMAIVGTASLAVRRYTWKGRVVS